MIDKHIVLRDIVVYEQQIADNSDIVMATIFLAQRDLGVVLSVKEVIKKNEIKGTTRYYDCSAEETNVGKVFMARAGFLTILTQH